jgi:hypothetical protein
MEVIQEKGRRGGQKTVGVVALCCVHLVRHRDFPARVVALSRQVLRKALPRIYAPTPPFPIAEFVWHLLGMLAYIQ